MNFKYFWRSTNTFSYNPFSVNIHFLLSFISSGIYWASFSLYLQFYYIIRKDVSFQKKKLYKFVYCHPFYIFFVFLFNCIHIIYINVHFLFISFGILFIFKIISHLVPSLRFCSDGSINICLFSHRQIFSIWCLFKCYSQFSFQFLNHLSPIKEIINF